MHEGAPGHACRARAAARAAATALLVALAAAGCSGSGEAGPAATTLPEETTTTVPEAPPAFAVSTGGNHTCAIPPAGPATCWGENTKGQLGDGTTTDRPVAGAVGTADPLVQISAGSSRHSCGLTATGRAVCWGQNTRGTIGDGTTADRPSPVDVVGLTGPVRTILAGGSHTCALLEDGSVTCWGRNDFAQLGNGTLADSPVPGAVVGLPEDVASLSLGGGHACVVTAAGGVVCWGLNRTGQIGNATTNDGQAPAPVPALSSGVAMVSAGGFHTCAVTTAGGVHCWGSNEYGQLGDGTTQNRLEPVPVSGLGSGVVAVSAGLFHTCALRADGTVSCWGKNGYGEMGDGTTTHRSTPVTPSGLPSSRVVQVSAGGGQTCAATADGALWCWGQNEFGQVGDGGSTNQLVPVRVG